MLMTPATQGIQRRVGWARGVDKPEMDAPDSGQGTLRVEPTVVLLPTAVSGAEGAAPSHP